MARAAWGGALSGLALLLGGAFTAGCTSTDLAARADDAPAPHVAAIEEDAPAIAAPTPPPAPTPEPDPDPAAEPDPEPVPPAVTTPAPPPVADPVRVSIPRLGVDAPLDAVGLEPSGSMEIPHDVRRIGWYSLGVAPGEPTGSAVLAGHVDSREQGRGALWALRTMQPGDEVTVSHDDGSASRWRVARTTSYPKEDLPIADIFTRFGDTQLVLITCGGEFDRSRRRYADNIVVYAEPVFTDEDITASG